MKNEFIITVVLTALMFPSLSVSATVTRASVQRAKISKTTSSLKVDISAVKDSALIMADDYAVALAEKPELASVRLNAFKRFYDRQPDAVRDTVSTVVFNCMADYVERGKNDRADAFKQCFLKVAKDNDPNLGPLYAMQIATAKERFDTAAIIRDIALLDDYARRMNVDYDSELDDARAWIYNIRTRKPIRDAIVGVWVSEELAGFKDDETGLAKSLPVLQIRDMRMCKEIGRVFSSDSVYEAHNWLEVAKSARNVSTYKEKAYGITVVGVDYYALDAYELPLVNCTALSEDYIVKTSPISHKRFLNDRNRRIASMIKMDNKIYSVYAFWGDERLKRNNAEVGAILRQTSQSMQASIAGELSRSKYSSSDALAGNLLAGMGGALVGGIVDALMVSRDVLWSVEITLHMDEPNMVTADIFTQLIKSASDNPKPEVKQFQHQTRYYRWAPEDSAFFVTPSSDENDLIFLHQVTKEDEKASREKAKSYLTAWKQHCDQNISERKISLKGIPKKSSQYMTLKEEIKKWEKQKKMGWSQWNKDMINRLKNKIKTGN